MVFNDKASSNISGAVSFLLRGAKKRRSYALANVKMLQNDMGIANKLAAVK